MLAGAGKATYAEAPAASSAQPARSHQLHTLHHLCRACVCARAVQVEALKKQLYVRLKYCRFAQGVSAEAAVAAAEAATEALARSAAIRRSITGVHPTTNAVVALTKSVLPTPHT